jgi:hypothetical protein
MPYLLFIPLQCRCTWRNLLSPFSIDYCYPNKVGSVTMLSYFWICNIIFTFFEAFTSPCIQIFYCSLRERSATALFDLTLSSVGTQISVFWFSLCSVPYILDRILWLTGCLSSLDFCCLRRGLEGCMICECIRMDILSINSWIPNSNAEYTIPSYFNLL